MAATRLATGASLRMSALASTASTRQSLAGRSRASRWQSFSASARARSPLKLAAEVQTPASANEGAGPLVILHGLYGSKQNWRSLAKGMATKLGRPVYSLDLRNHGESPHSEAATYTDMAADVGKFMEDEGLRDVVLTGHSMGGKVAMALALTQPEAVSKMIVVDIAPGVGAISPEFSAYCDAMMAIDEAKVTSRKEADAILAKTEPALPIRQFLLTNMDRASGSEPYKFRIPLHFLRKAIDGIGDFPFEAGKVTWDKPSLFIKGAKSKYINKRNTPLISQFFPNSRLETLDTGHWVHAERPKEFVDLVAGFCDE